jgi:hypothetical protein
VASDQPEENADEAADEAAWATWLDAGREAVRAAKGDRERVAAAVFAFCQRGRRQLLLAPLVVWDYLAISYPTLLGEAGFSDDEVEQLAPDVEQAWLHAYEGWHATEGSAAERPAD